MKVNHEEVKTGDYAYDKEIIIQQLIILAVIMLWLIISAFLFSGCLDSLGADGSSNSATADTSSGITDDSFDDATYDLSDATIFTSENALNIIVFQLIDMSDQSRRHKQLSV